MTIDEAIRIIKIVLFVAEDFEIIVQGEEFTKEKCKEAVEIVTKALAQEPCADAISRQAAIDACLNGWNKDYKEIVEEIRALPPVKPQYTDTEIQKMQDLEFAEIQKAYELGKAEQPKIGRWVYNKNLSTHYGDVYICSECGERCLESCYDHIDKLPDFCPKCHTKMEVEK
jgi:hypothetical protein